MSYTSTTKTINKKWHDFQVDHQYVDNIDTCQKIRISTTKDNAYVFTRESTGSDQWQYRVNGIWAEENGTRKIINITLIDDVINFIYSKVDRITKRPWEIPIDLTLN